MKISVIAFFPLNVILWRFNQVIAGISGFLQFDAEKYSVVWMPHIHGRTSGLFPGLGYYE